MQMTEKRIIHMEYGQTFLDKIAKSVTREWTDYDNIDKQLKAHRLRCLRHLERMNVNSLVKRVRKKAIEIIVRRGRPKKMLKEAVKDDMKRRNLALQDV